MAFISSTPARAGFGQSLLSPVRAVVQAINYIRACNVMARDYEQMSHKTDGALARNGLTREDIPDAVRRNAGLF
ncbi:hypothetical protein [Roseivivax sediminis]|uniref:Uncharacterized protein n=1 Tax=Roseivivax sediminis TaxID=936889 RepID=A0A1I2AEF7_9RHOB|nr:hypothetical protein [Roseivivax sediminis]SFE42404.1 hypothetical protein SAMN04515678_109203 [Roseivivax sediminis]